MFSALIFLYLEELLLDELVNSGIYFVLAFAVSHIYSNFIINLAL